MRGVSEEYYDVYKRAQWIDQAASPTGWRWATPILGSDGRGSMKLKNRLRYGLLISAPLLLAGCSSTAHAPAIPIFGSFFPAWIICALGGIVLAMVVRALFIAIHIDEHLPAPPLVYLCLSVSLGIGLYMVWSGVA